MKKIFYLLLGALSFFQIKATASVNIPDVSTNDNPVYYFIKSYRSGNFLKANGESNNITHEALTLDDSFKWYFTGTKTDNVVTGKICNKSLDGVYLASEKSFTAEGITWYIQANKFPENQAKGVVLSKNIDMTQTGACLDANNGNTGVGTYQPTADDWQGTTWITLTAKEVYEDYKSRIEVLLTDKEAKIGQYGYPTETAFTALANALNEAPAGTTDDDYINSALKLGDAILAFNQAPIKKLENGYYRFICKNSAHNAYFGVNTFGAYPDEDANVIVKENKENPSLTSLWKLTATENGNNESFTFQNAATGEYLSNIGKDYKGSIVFTTTKAQAAISITYKYKENEGYGNVAIKGNNITMFLNGNYPISYGDGIGSVWTPVPVEANTLDTYVSEDLMNKLSSWYESESKKTPVYFGHNNFQIQKAESEKAAFLSNKTYANYWTYLTKVESTKFIPNENAYYYIISAYNSFKDGKNRAIYLAENGDLKWKLTESNEASMLWKLSPSTDEQNSFGINITNANNGQNILGAGYSGKYLFTTKNHSWTPVSSICDKGIQLIHYYINSDGKPDRQTMAMNGTEIAAPTEKETENTITSYNSDAINFATQWYVIEATNVNVTTQATSNGNWCTAYLPVGVELPEEATAYSISGTKENQALLNKITDGIVPAENGVLIKSETAGKLELSLVNNATDKISGNLLQGTLVKADVADNAYIFGDATDGLGFYKIDTNDKSIAGNKAYLVLPAAQSNIRSIIIGGPTTGIEDTVAEGTEAEEYYDLQGRRVMNPTKGIYVTKSGKKVVFNK